MSEPVILCGCIDGVVAIDDDSCFPLNLSLEQAAKSYEEVQFVRFSDVSAVMLEFLLSSKFFEEVLLCLCSTEPDGPHYSHVQLLAMEMVQKLKIVQAVGGIAGERRTDTLLLIEELTQIFETGTLYLTEGK